MLPRIETFTHRPDCPLSLKDFSDTDVVEVASYLELCGNDLESLSWLMAEIAREGDKMAIPVLHGLLINGALDSYRELAGLVLMRHDLTAALRVSYGLVARAIRFLPSDKTISRTASEGLFGPHLYLSGKPPSKKEGEREDEVPKLLAQSRRLAQQRGDEQTSYTFLSLLMLNEAVRCAWNSECTADDARHAYLKGAAWAAVVAMFDAVEAIVQWHIKRLGPDMDTTELIRRERLGVHEALVRTILPRPTVIRPQ